MSSESEQFAKTLIESHLQKPVWIHDDGSENSMFDLGIGDKNNPQYAIECIGVMDQMETETWNLGPGKGTRKWSLKGDWAIGIGVKTKIKSLRTILEPILGKLENSSSYFGQAIYVDYNLKRVNFELFNKLENLDIDYIQMFRSNGEGKIEMSMDGNGGVKNILGFGISDWITEYLSEPKNKDVIYKLSISSAINNEVFMHIVPGKNIPWKVLSYFMSDNEKPIDKPNLLNPITGVWIVCFEYCLYWNGVIWNKFIHNK